MVIGISEDLGGLLHIGGTVWLGFRYLPPQTDELASGVDFAVPGMLYIIYGWYALAQRKSRHSPDSLIV